MYMHWEKAMWTHNKKVAIYNLREELPLDVNPAGTLILNFQFAELWEN